MSTRLTPYKVCTMCGHENANGRKLCAKCGFQFYAGRDRKVLSLADAMQQLMDHAAHTGGPRVAWSVCFKKLKRYDPSVFDFITAGWKP